MDHAVRDQNIGGAIGEWQPQIIRDNARRSETLLRQTERHATAVNPDAANSTTRHKSEHSPGTASNIENKRLRVETLN